MSKKKTSTNLSLSEDKLQALREEAEKYKTAQRQLAEAMGVLWNSRLDMAIALEDTDRIEDAIGDMPMFLDDCSCNDACNPQCPPIETK